MTNGYSAAMDLFDLPKNGEHIALLLFPDFFFFQELHGSFDESKFVPIYGLCSHQIILASTQFSSVGQLFDYLGDMPDGEKLPVCSPTIRGASYLTHTIFTKADERAEKLEFKQCLGNIPKMMNEGTVPLSYMGVPSALNLTEGVSVLGVSSEIPIFSINPPTNIV